MVKKRLRKDTEITNPLRRKSFPDPSIPMPKAMNVKSYRTKPIKKTYGEYGGDMQVVIKKVNPKPSIMKIIEREDLNMDMLKRPRKYARLS